METQITHTIMGFNDVGIMFSNGLEVQFDTNGNETLLLNGIIVG